MSKLDDVLRLLDYSVGNTERLARIRDTLEDNNILDVYDARYLQNLVDQYLVGDHLIESSYSLPSSTPPPKPSTSNENDAVDQLDNKTQSSPPSSKLVDDQALIDDVLPSSLPSPPPPSLSPISIKRHKLLYAVPLFFCIFGSLLTVITHSSTTGLLSVGGTYLNSTVIAMLTIGLTLISLFLIQQKHIHDIKRQLQCLSSANAPVAELDSEIQTPHDTRIELQKDFPNTADIISLQNKNKELYDKFKIRDAELLETINQFIQNAAQDMERLHKDTLQHTTDKIADYVETYLDEHSVSKEDFKNLKDLVQEMSHKTKSNL